VNRGEEKEGEGWVIDEKEVKEEEKLTGAEQSVDESGQGGGDASKGERGERVEAAFWELGRALDVETSARARARRRRSDAGRVQLTSRDLTALTWTGEQYAVFQPQLEQLLGCGRAIAYRTRSRWLRGGWADARIIRADQPPLVWLTRDGLRMCELEYPTWRPSAAMLAHVHAVNQVRLALAEARPDWAWTCERELARRQPRTASGVRLGHRHDALITTDQGEEIPIEVELTQKAATRTEGILREALRTYNQVWYFAPPARGRSIEKTAERLALRERVTVDAIPTASGS